MALAPAGLTHPAIARTLEGWAQRFGLTQAELGVLALAVDGTTQRGIALKRNVRPSTVKKQAAVILEKTSSVSLVDAARALLLEALTTPEGFAGSGYRGATPSTP